MIDDLNKAAQDAGYTGETVDNHTTEKDNDFFVITLDGQLMLTKSWEDTRKFIEQNVVKKNTFIILAKKTPSSRSVKGHSPVSRWGMNWLRTRNGRKPS